MHLFFLGLIHVDDELGHAWVGLPQFVEAEDEFYPRGPVQDGAVLLEVVEDCSDRDAGVKRPGDAQLLDPRRFDNCQDKFSSTYLDCMNAALVGRPSCQAVLHPSHLGETVVLQKSFDVWVVVGARFVHEVKVPSVIRLVDGFGEDRARSAAGGRPSEGDTKGAHDKRLVELLKVSTTRICCDGAGRVARLLEDGVDVGQFGHDEGGWSARRVVRLM